MIRLVGLAAMMAIALVTAAAPTLAQGERAAERAATQAQDAVQGMDQALKEAQGAEREASQGTVQAEEKGKVEEKGKGKAKGKGKQKAAVTTIPESGGISTGNVALLAFGGSTLVGGAWLFTRRATR